jgi:hypothetical protein
MRIHLLDLSAKGALGHAEHPPKPGAIVWMVCKGCEVLSRTAWVRGTRFGLAFDRPIPSATLQPLLAEGRRGLQACGEAQAPAFA